MRLLLTAILLFVLIPHARGEDTYSLTLAPFRWPPSAIPVYVDPSAPDFARRGTQMAMEAWNRAQDWFVGKYSYLLNNRPLQYRLYETGFQGSKAISVYFKPYSNPDTQGVTRGTPPYVDITIFLVTEDGKLINEVAVQNIALKELGHALGIGGVSLQSDAMYGYSLDVENMTLLPSTLDLYGLYVIGSGFSRQYMDSDYAVNLPPQISYEVPSTDWFSPPLNQTRTIILGQ